MMKTTMLRRARWGTQAANGTVPRAVRERAASEGAAYFAKATKAEATTAKATKAKAGITKEVRWLDAERSIWEGSKISEDRRFVLIGNQVTIKTHGRWQGYWGFVRAAKDGRVTVELSSMIADGSVIELPAEDVSYAFSECSERYAKIERYSRLTVDAKWDKKLSPDLRAAMLHRAALLKQDIDWLGRHDDCHSLTHQAVKQRLGMASNHITAIVPWTGGGK